MKLITIEEATKKWMGEWNAIPQDLIKKAYPMMEEDGLSTLSSRTECSHCGEVKFTKNEDDESICTNCDEVDSETTQYGLPMWGTMWTFGTNLDDEWVKENLDIMNECGIWVFESDELGILLGIDGAGYDFYESHWIPLYKARGLQWHKEEENGQS